MLTIRLKFPGGRYHATPWGRHVNEAVPEWPPSPYRLVRALYDVWKRKCPDWTPERVEPLLAALGSEAPRFLLPVAGASHTRSYLHKNTEDPAGKTLIFDGFVAVHPDSDVLMHWPTAELNATQHADLETLLRLLNFLGRSESWVIAELTDEARDWNCAPATEADGDGELVEVACPTSKREYTRARMRGAPKSWLDALTYSTTQMLRAKVSEPPAMRRVPYVRDERALEPPPVHTEWSQPEEVTAVLYSLSGPVLPRLKAAAEVAEQVRRRLMGQHKRLMREDSSLVSPKFSGHDRAGNALTGHQHCFILPFSERQWGHIDRVLVWCNQPFDRYETLALHRLSELGWTEPKIRVVPVTAGPSARLRPKSRIVQSVTPFIPGRHYRRGRGDFFAWLASELRHECENHGLPQPVSIRLVPKPRGATMWREFRRNRKGEPPRYGCGFRLEFPVPVAAPFSLGYGCHFGLGQFHAPAE